MNFSSPPRQSSCESPRPRPIPAGWEVRRLKYIASINDDALPETTAPDRAMAYVDISSVDAKVGITAVEEMTFEEAPSRARRLVKDGDTIVSTVRTYLRAIAPIKQPRDDLVVSTGFAVIRPRRVRAGYLSSALRESHFVETIVARSVGVSYPAVNASDLGDIPLPVPPEGVQRRIEVFLNRETAKIDTLVAKKRLLIAKLREKRSALISRTVTRGLPPDAARAAGLDPHRKLKLSGIDWLGAVPEHWEVHSLKRVWTLCEYGMSESLSGDGNVRVLTMGNVQDGRVSIPDRGCLQDVPIGMLLRKGDLLYNRTNSLAHVGKVGIYEGVDDEPVTFASYLVRLRTNERALPAYLNFILNTPQILERARTLALPSINQANLNPTRYGQIQIAMPPVAEQVLMVAFLDRETAKIDTLIAKVESAIDRLQEYRSALITAAVTGQIDVRDVEPADARPRQVDAAKVSV